MKMFSLECKPCNNCSDFIEKVQSEWYVNGSGEREGKIYEDAVYICCKCGKPVYEDNK